MLVELTIRLSKPVPNAYDDALYPELFQMKRIEVNTQIVHPKTAMCDDQNYIQVKCEETLYFCCILIAEEFLNKGKSRSRRGSGNIDPYVERAEDFADWLAKQSGSSLQKLQIP